MEAVSLMCGIWAGGLVAGLLVSVAVTVLHDLRSSLMQTLDL